jgi:hypothetical protein
MITKKMSTVRDFVWLLRENMPVLAKSATARKLALKHIRILREHPAPTEYIQDELCDLQYEIECMDAVEAMQEVFK